MTERVLSDPNFAAAAVPAGYALGAGTGNTVFIPNMYGGKGTIEVRHFFRREGFAAPAVLLIYIIPPGAGEGTHTHEPGNTLTGSFDEFYYIIAGKARMEVDGRHIDVERGEYVFVPNGVPHGIENPSEDTPLEVHLVAMARMG